jgi:O-glycosyl hydrolase
MAAHSYWTNTPVPYMRKIREQLRDVCNKYGIKFWQTEICIMGNDTEIGGGQGYDFTMKTALYVARVIHHDLTYADAESWSWWRACGGDYKDGLIRVYNRAQRGRDSKLLWALGNYSRFVRPGAVRHELSGEEDPYGLMATAYRNTDGRWVLVVINYGGQPRTIDITSTDKKHQWTLYRTSDTEGENLLPVGKCQGRAVLPARSITTWVE